MESIQSIQGHEIRILKLGVKDESKFINYHAELEINGRLMLGDIIFTETIREFYREKYHLASPLNRCILHVAFRDEFTNLRIRLNNGKTIPTVVMGENADVV